MKYDSAFVPRLPDGSSIGMKLLFQLWKPCETFFQSPTNAFRQSYIITLKSYIKICTKKTIK